MRKVILILFFSVLCFAQTPCDVYAQLAALLNEKLDSQRVEIDNLRLEVTSAVNQITTLQEQVKALEDANANR